MFPQATGAAFRQLGYNATDAGLAQITARHRRVAAARNPPDTPRRSAENDHIPRITDAGNHVATSLENGDLPRRASRNAVRTMASPVRRRRVSPRSAADPAPNASAATRSATSRTNAAASVSVSISASTPASAPEPATAPAPVRYPAIIPPMARSVSEARHLTPVSHAQSRISAHAAPHARAPGEASIARSRRRRRSALMPAGISVSSAAATTASSDHSATRAQNGTPNASSTEVPEPLFSEATEEPSSRVFRFCRRFR